MTSTQGREIFQRAIAPAEPEIKSREIPLCKRAARLRRIARPTFEFVSRRLLFRAIKLVQFRENPGKIDIGRSMLDKILQAVVPVLRRLQLQMRVGQTEERRGQRFVARGSRIFQELFKSRYRAVWSARNHFEATSQTMALLFF